MKDPKKPKRKKPPRNLTLLEHAALVSAGPYPPSTCTVTVHILGADGQPFFTVSMGLDEFQHFLGLADPPVHKPMPIPPPDTPPRGRP
jgi:hypothetical protein